MPKYDFVCPRHGKVEKELSYAQFDLFVECAAKCAVRTGGRPCGQTMTRDYTEGVPVATFYGSDFTRRSTDSRQNMNIDHHDPRSNESYPGKPNKKARRDMI